MWLLRRLTPDFKTIADFRRDNRKPIRNVSREFTLFCRQLDLFSGDLVAIDGSKFKAVNSRIATSPRKQLKRTIQKLDEDIDRYLDEMDQADAEGARGEEAHRRRAAGEDRGDEAPPGRSGGDGEASWTRAGKPRSRSPIPTAA